MTASTQQLPVMVLEAKEGFRYDKTLDGWRVESDCGPVVGEPTLALHEFLCEGESCVQGDIIIARAKEMGGPAGQSVAERMLEQADRIPVEWRQFVLMLVDTVWVGPGGGHGVVFLLWFGGQWYLRFIWLGHDFGSDYRLVRLAPDAAGEGASK